MALVKVNEDIIHPHPTRDGAGHLIARKGDTVDERILKGIDAPAPSLVTSKSVVVDAGADDVPVGDYGDLPVAELRKVADERGIDTHGEDGKLVPKQQLVEALEYDDERRGL